MSWPTMTQDWPEEASSVRRIPRDSAYLEPEVQPAHEQTRRQILSQASNHVELALVELGEAVAWFNVIHPEPHSDLIRRVEALRDTIDYYASL